MPPKLILGYIIRDEADLVATALSKMRSYFDGAVAIDACSKDNTVDVLKSYDVNVESREWDYDYSAARNACIKFAERLFSPPRHAANARRR